MKLWVDDLREPPGHDWMWAKTPDDAIALLSQLFCERISLDHDLGLSASGAELTSRPVVLWMCDNDRWPATVAVHTANPVGRQWLEGMVARYGPH